MLLVFQGVGVSGWLVVGEGLPAVRVLPVQQCQKHCSSFNLWLGSGDMGKGLLGDTAPYATQQRFYQNQHEHL